MQLFKIVFERIPIVWFLLGLLFVAGGLYLGFDNSLAFVYIFVGLFCCAYGLALFVLRYATRQSESKARPLSRNFISMGSATAAGMSGAGHHAGPSRERPDDDEA